MDITFKKADGSLIVTDEDRRLARIGNLTLRFTLQPVAVDTVLLFAGIVPFSKDELRTRMGARGLDISSPLASTIALKLYNMRGKTANGKPVAFLPQEQREDGLGLGHLPLLEMIGAGPLTFPDHDALEEELVEFLRRVTATNNVASARLEEMYSEGGFPSAPNGRITHEWPPYRGPVEQGTAAAVSTGLFLLLHSGMETKH